MNPEITKIIEQYLAGELSVADTTAFEERLKANEELQEEVELQRTIHNAAKRVHIRSEVQSVSSQYHLFKKLKWGGLGLGILAIVAATSIYLMNYQGSNSDFSLDEVEELTEKLDKQGPIDNLKSEFFAWNSADTAFLSTDGVLVSVPENAFLLNGQPYKDPAVIQWQEALDGASIVKSGLSTTSDGKLLETQGMFSFSAKTKTGEQLTINPKVGVYVQVPVDEYKEGMQLFDGEKDANGMINWVKPRELEKIPLPVSMADLDFYPPEYEAKLNELKARKGKTYRDSLYLSFEEDNLNNDSTMNQPSLPFRIASESVEIFPPIEASFMGGAQALKVYFFENIHYPQDAVDRNIEGIVYVDLVISESGNISDVFVNRGVHESIDKEAVRVVKEMPPWYPAQDLTGKFVPSQITIPITFVLEGEPDSIEPFRDQEETPLVPINKVDSVVEIAESANQIYIPPSSVLAFWKPKFNNTLLATREFEARMQEIHRTCDKSVLDIYVKNLKKPMHELDKRVVNKGYPQFKNFVDQKVGALNPNNPHLNGLTDFYDAAVKQLKNQEKTLREQEEKRQNKWDKEVNEERQKEVVRTSKRDAQAFDEEYTLNHKNVRKQLGRVLGATIYGDSPICNIDRFVRETTIARKTGEFYDEVSGKTARIQYNEFSFTVSNAKEYKQLYAYLFPHELNSYHRLDGKSGAFSYSLNDAVLYDLAIVGISEEGYSYVQRRILKGGDLGELQLERVSEAKVNASIRQLNSKRGVKPFDVIEELRWLKKEQKNYVEQKRRTDNRKFRNDLIPHVFPCCGLSEATDTTAIVSRNFWQ